MDERPLVSLDGRKLAVALSGMALAFAASDDHYTAFCAWLLTTYDDRSPAFRDRLAQIIGRGPHLLTGAGLLLAEEADPR